MGVEQGYSKIATSGLVFAYDTGDQRNSYKGKPGYNVAANVVDNIGNNNSTYDPGYFFITTVGAETVNIPALGTYDNVRFCAINNGYTGYGTGGNFNCCPSLFNYGLPMTVGVTGNTLYTYSIIYKTQSGYTHPNFMYRYEYNGGTYLTEAGAFDSSKRVDLGDGWYWAYNTFTTQPTCDRLFLYLFYYQYNTPDKVWVKNAMIVQGDYKLPPLNFLSGNQTRSSTQGLLDISGGGSSINLSSVSFDTNAQYYFDGTDDYISIPNTTSFGNFTAEVVIKPTSYPGNAASAITTEYPGSNSTVNFNIGFDGSTFMGGFYNGSSGGWHQIFTSLPTLNVYSHYVLTFNGAQMIMYKNGVSVGTFTTNDIAAGGNPIRIGRRWDIGDYFPGRIDVAKVYNRALSQSEITTNYNSYKKRFNLS